MDEDVTRRRRARRLEVVTASAAGSVGGMLGGAKLRDTFAEEHPQAFLRGEKRAAGTIGKPAAKFLAHAKPGFKPLAAGTVTAVTAGAARRHGQRLDRKIAAKHSHPHPGEPVTTAKRLVAKKFEPERERVFSQVDEADNFARSVRSKVLPNKVIIARRLSVASSNLKAKVQQDMGKAYDRKAYDPKRGPRQRAEALEMGAVAGGTALAARSIRDRSLAGREFVNSVGEEAAGRQRLRLSRSESGVVGDHLTRYHQRLSGDQTKRPITRQNLHHTSGIHAGSTRHLNSGVESLERAYGHGRQGERLLARSNRGTLAAVGLTAVAIGAHRKARRNR